MILNIHKPAGMTSRDVVNRVQRLVRPEKCGHAGTLDPLATGVLLVCVGSSTRLVPYLHELPKTYVGTFQLGCESTTDDAEGEVTQLAHATPVCRRDLVEIIPEYVGRIQQVPPAYSAVWIDGRRAYKLARQGEQVSIPAREVHIHRLELVAFEGDHFTLEIECGTGTYVRSIGRDMARRLGSGAIMTALERTAIGPFPLNQSLPLDQVSLDTIKTHAAPPISALPHLPRVVVTPEEALRLAQGQIITLPRLTEMLQLPLLSNDLILPGDRTGREVAAVDDAGNLMAVVTVEEASLKPQLVFLKRSS